MEAPELADFIDFATGKVDFLNFSIAIEEFEEFEIYSNVSYYPPIIIRC